MDRVDSGGLALGWAVSPGFTAAVFAVWVMGCVYNIPPLRSKDHAHADVVSEAINNPLRLLAGWAIVGPKARQLSLRAAVALTLGYGLASILLAPSKGLLIDSPFLAFGLMGACLFWRRNGSPLTPYLSLWVVASLVWLAKFRLWWGGTAYGPRYLSDATLPLVLLTASLWPVIRARRVLFSAFAGTLLLSISIHFVGAFFAPCDWQTTPQWADYYPERHWDWRDPEILRCLSQGLKQGPLPPELLRPGT